MRKRYWLWGVRTLAVVAVALMSVQAGYGQTGPCPSLGLKTIPTLSLVKSVPVGGDDVTAPDTLYVSEAGPGERRYFLLPVFINNTLDSVDRVFQTPTGPVTVSGEPIFSFRFKLQYNRTLLRAIGVQKRGVLPQDTNVAAKNFNLSWDVDADPLYKRSTVGAPDPTNGERIMITGSSSIPLPLPKRADAPPPPQGNNKQFRDTAVMLYVLFEVIGQAGGATNERDQVILTQDSIRFNDITPSYPDSLGAPTPVSQDLIDRCFDPNPNVQQGIAPAPLYPVSYTGAAKNFGSQVVVITERPKIQLFSGNQNSRVRVVDAPAETQYELVNMMQTFYGNTQPVFRNLLIRNATPISGTTNVLRNVQIETDQPWLRIDTNGPFKVGTDTGSRELFLREVPNTQLNFNVVANPNLIPDTDINGYPTPGIYIGYVTVRAVEANNSAVRLKVTLLVTRNPLENTLNPNNEPTRSRGIQLLVRNSGPTPDTTYLTFGTGIGATDGVDTLFGEVEAAADDTVVPGTFFARFFPFDQIDGRPFRGLLDTRGLNNPSNGESSIDIRNFRTNSTLVYCVRFGGGAPQNYPVIVEYDTRDFPNGSQLFVRDNVNGQSLSSNLRTSTSLGGTRRQFTILDPNVTSFCIEYTVPAVVQFPEINKGWNFVSLPVRPSDARSQAVFPNLASGKPIRFTQNQYFGEDTVRIGVGYFVKYGDIIDSTVPGTQVREIHEIRTRDSVRLYAGWNTVGSISVTTTVDNSNGYGMNFGPIGGFGNPQRISEVYRYITDRGYEQASLIVPGYGYWVKVDRDGFYRLSAPPNAFPPKASAVNESYRGLNRLTIADNSQKVGTLFFGQTSVSVDNSRFELPPAPAAEMFDVRFDNNGFVSASQDVAAERVVSIQGVEYPLVLSVARPDADYIVSDAVTGQVIGRLEKGKEGAITISNPMTKSVRLTGVASSEMNLGEAFPNPAVSNLSFNFNVAGEQGVTIALYSPLGQQVATLFQGSANGQQTVEFSTEGLPSGVYLYKMTTTSGFSQVRQVVISK